MGLDAAQDWSPFRRQRAAERIAALAKRQRIVDSYAGPAEMMAACNPEYVITPAVKLISDKIELVLRSRRKRLAISAPPQEMKSMLCAVATPVRAQQLHPNWRVMLLTYADGLAEEHSRAARALIQEHGSGVIDTLTGAALPDRLGISLHPSLATAANWRIAQGDGGMVAAGRDATITGKRADLIIIDDPFKNMQEADSASMREKVWIWYASVAQTRLAPGGSIILIQTRWNQDDLCGRLLKNDRELPPELREWHYINIPAISDHTTFDTLKREPDVPLESARGRTKADFEAIRRTVGRRVWNALYQGNPTPPEGGLFSSAWFDGGRLPDPPDRTRVRVVAVDPAETGDADEAGVIGAALLYPAAPEARTVAKMMLPEGEELPPEPLVALTHDRSGQMTSDAWARAAVDLAIEIDASHIFIETYTAGTTYPNIVRTEISKRIAPLAALARRGAAEPEDQRLLSQLTTLLQRVSGWRGTGDAVARSGLLRQAVEVGTCVVVGHELAEMETQAINWMVGQHQPDRVAAAVIAHDRLIAMVGKQVQIGRPLGSAGNRNAAWLGRKVG